MSKPNPYTPSQHQYTSDDDVSLEKLMSNGDGDGHDQLPFLPASPAFSTKKTANQHANASNAPRLESNTATTFFQSNNSSRNVQPYRFRTQEHEQSSPSHSSLSIKGSTSSSSYETKSEVVPNVSGYFLYQNAANDHFRRQYPQMSQDELSRYTSRQYKSLDTQTKAAWTEQASLLNAAKLNEEHSNHGSHFEVPQKKSPRKKRKDPNAPKRAVGAYVWFTMDERPKIQKEFKGIKFADMGKMLGERWRNLNPEEKKKYNLMASEDRKRLQVELKAYNEDQSRRLQKARKAQADKQMQEQYGSHQDAPQPVADVNRYSPEYEFSEEFCADIVKRLSEDE